MSFKSLAQQVLWRNTSCFVTGRVFLLRLQIYALHKSGKHLYLYRNPIKKVSDFVGFVNAVIFSPNDIFTEYISNVLPELGEDNTLQKSVDFGVKKQQFTSEKILEDELMLRIEKGLPVFGLNLKLYRRNGEYGRQYILANNKRLDILAEDNDGNLYIIELKKDSGYDDAYAQTAEYLDWFDEHWKEPVKNIYGIIAFYSAYCCCCS